ncbi:MAG: hypothetical protein HY721_22310 [Planctomycetes bacterium]|nr:hypothetical protein [Planctomycetota bacterium]
MPGFSSTVRKWIDGQAVLRAAKERFRREWAGILGEAAARLADRGWGSRFLGHPSDLIQVFRPDWPSGPSQVHYEALVQHHFRRRGIIDLSLHVEHETPNQAAVCAALRRLLAPHARAIPACCSVGVTDSPLHDILKGSLPLDGVTGEKLFEAFEKLAETASFVDQALFVAGNTPVWRTDFSADREEIWLEWFGSKGGQELAYGAGRLGSAALRIDGSRPNARPEMKYEKGSYSVLVHPTKGLRNGARHYGSIALKTTRGAHVVLRAEGHKGQTPEGHPKQLPQAFAWAGTAEPSEGWQCLTWESPVPPVEEAGYDFSRDGAWLVLVVDTEDRACLIDGVEVGRVAEGT